MVPRQIIVEVQLKKMGGDVGQGLLVVGKMVFLDQSHCHNRTKAAFFCVLKDEANKGKEKKKNH